MKYGIFDRFFLHGFRAIEDTKPQEYKVSSLLVQDTRKLNSKLNKLLNIKNKEYIDLEEIRVLIIKAFDLSEGEVETKINTSAVSYDGHVGYVQVYGTIDKCTTNIDLSLMHEDLILAFYKSRGGTFGLSRDLLNFIDNDIKESRYSKFTEI